MTDPAVPYNVFVRGLRLFGHHGLHETERDNGNWFTIDLEAQVYGTTPIDDDVEDTADYGAMAATATEVVAEGGCRTVEHLAHQIAEAILDAVPQVEALQISVTKEPVPLAIPMAGAGVRLTVRREPESDA